MYKILSFVSKQDGLSFEDFKTLYEEQLVPFVLSLSQPAPLVYKRHYLNRDTPIQGTAKNLIDFDAVTEIGFADKAALQTWASNFRENEEGKALELKILKPEVMRVYEVDERVTADTKADQLAARGIANGYTVLFFVSKKSDLDLASFKDYAESTHVNILLSFGPTPLVFRRCYFDRSANLRPTSSGAASLAFDLLSLTTFESEEAFRSRVIATLQNPESGAVIAASEEKLLDRERRMMYAADSRVSLDA